MCWTETLLGTFALQQKEVLIWFWGEKMLLSPTNDQPIMFVMAVAVSGERMSAIGQTWPTVIQRGRKKRPIFHKNLQKSPDILLWRWSTEIWQILQSRMGKKHVAAVTRTAFFFFYSGSSQFYSYYHLGFSSKKWTSFLSNLLWVVRIFPNKLKTLTCIIC